LIDGLKTQPLALALIVINALFLGTAIWLFHEVAVAAITEREHRNKLTMELLSSCGDKIREDIADLQHALDRLVIESRATPKPPELKP
jgi:hypothetical protein